MTTLVGTTTIVEEHQEIRERDVTNDVICIDFQCKHIAIDTQI